MDINKLGSVEYFEQFIENSMKKNNESSHESLYRIGFGLFDLIGEGSFSSSRKEQLNQLQNLREAMNRISKRLQKWGESVL